MLSLLLLLPPSPSISLSVYSSDECSLISSKFSWGYCSCLKIFSLSGYHPSSLSLINPLSSSYALSLHLYVESPAFNPPPKRYPPPIVDTPLTLNILSLLVLNYSLIIDSWSSSYSIKCPIYPKAILFKLEWC